MKRRKLNQTFNLTNPNIFSKHKVFFNLLMLNFHLIRLINHFKEYKVKLNQLYKLLIDHILLINKNIIHFMTISTK